MRIMLVLRNGKQAGELAAKLSAAAIYSDVYPSLSDASEALASFAYDLIVVGADEGNDRSLKWLKGKRAGKPVERSFVIVLAERESDRVDALIGGADDSVRPNIGTGELVAKIRALLRRARHPVNDTLAFGDLSLSTMGREITVKGEPVAMQRRETVILEALLRRIGRVAPRAALEHDVYGLQAEFCPNSLEVRISRIRRRLELASSDVCIETVRGIGYRLARRVGADHYGWQARPFVQEGAPAT